MDWNSTEICIQHTFRFRGVVLLTPLSLRSGSSSHCLSHCLQISSSHRLVHCSAVYGLMSVSNLPGSGGCGLLGGAGGCVQPVVREWSVLAEALGTW